MKKLQNEPQANLPNAYLLSLDVQHGHTTARIDCGWTQIAALSYTNGREVIHLVDKPFDLRGSPRATKLYLGYGYFKRQDWFEFREFIRYFEFKTYVISEMMEDPEWMQDLGSPGA